MDNDIYQERKAAFDARLEFTKVIRQALEACISSRLQGNLAAYHASLEQLFVLVSPFISNDARIKINNNITVTRRRVDFVGSQNNRSISSIRNDLKYKLFDIHKSITEASHHLLLPTGGDDSDEVDWDSIRKRGST